MKEKDYEELLIKEINVMENFTEKDFWDVIELYSV